MTQDAAAKRRITAWVSKLALLVSSGSGDDRQLQLYVEMLEREDLPAAAFCEGSLHAVAREQSWWPDYATLRKQLRDWWSVNKPALAPALHHDGQDRLSVQDRAWLDYFNRRINESPEKRDTLLSLLRTYAPAAHVVLVPPAGRDRPDEAEAGRGHDK